jgi:hypothetical protein
MNKQELKEALISLGIKPGHYTIDGESYKDSSWVLDISFNRFSFIKKYKVWHVFHFERGQRYEEKTFHTEDEACTYIYEKLTHLQEIIKKFNLENW